MYFVGQVIVTRSCVSRICSSAPAGWALLLPLLRTTTTTPRWKASMCPPTQTVTIQTMTHSGSATTMRDDLTTWARFIMIIPIATTLTILTTAEPLKTRTSISITTTRACASEKRNKLLSPFLSLSAVVKRWNVVNEVMAADSTFRLCCPTGRSGLLRTL